MVINNINQIVNKNDKKQDDKCQNDGLINQRKKISICFFSSLKSMYICL